MAGSATSNGPKQGLFVGVTASMALVALQAQSPWTVVLTVVSCFTLTLVGGWFGGQLFPPVQPIIRGRRVGSAA